MSSSARNGFVVRITLTLNGETATKDITYNQAAGYFTYANPVINATYPMIPASGGTVTPHRIVFSNLRLEWCDLRGWYGYDRWKYWLCRELGEYLQWFSNCWI